MSKRQQTTAGPKVTRRPTAQTGAAEGQNGEGAFHSHAEQEQKLQRYVTLGAAVISIVVIAMLVIAFVYDGIMVPNQVVANVDGQTFNVSDFQKRVRLTRVQHINQLVGTWQTMQGFGWSTDQIGQYITQQEPYKTWYNELQIPDQLGLTVINEMVDEQLVRAEAKARGLTVSADQIEAQIQQYFGYDAKALQAAIEATAEVTQEATTVPTATPTPFVSPTPSPVPTATLMPTATPTPEVSPTPSATPLATVAPTNTPEAAVRATQSTTDYRTSRDSLYNTWRSQTGMSDADIHTYFEYRALREQLRDAVTSDITDQGVYVDVRHILVASEEEALDIIAALKAGESFAELAKAASIDTGSGSTGGELGWAPVTNYVQEFQDAVKAATLSEIVGPVKSEFGYHVLQVRAREERPLDADQVTQAKEGAFSTWLKAYKEQKKDQTQIFDVWASHVPDDPPSPFK